MKKKSETGQINPIDVHVGSQLRLRRLVIGMSQQALGQELGVTFQQVQKYEKGANRIGASRLWKISTVLDVPVNFFFEGLSNGPQMPGFAEPEQSPIIYDFIKSPDGIALATAFVAINESDIRRKLLELARVLAN